MKKLFKEFGSLDASVSRKYRGSGLGLAISKRMWNCTGGKSGQRANMAKGVPLPSFTNSGKRQELSTTV